MGNSPSRPNEYNNNNNVGQSAHTNEDDLSGKGNGLDDPDDSRRHQTNIKTKNITKTDKAGMNKQFPLKKPEVIDEVFDFESDTDSSKNALNSRSTSRRNSSTKSFTMEKMKKTESYSTTNSKSTTYSSSYTSSNVNIGDGSFISEEVSFEKVKSLDEIKNDTADYKLNFTTLQENKNPAIKTKITEKKTLTSKNKDAHDSLLKPPVLHVPTPLASLATSSSVSSGSTNLNELPNNKPSINRESNNLISSKNVNGFKGSKHTNKVLNVDDCIERLRHLADKNIYQKKFPFEKWEIELICMKAREVFLSQPSLLKLKSPTKVVGDVHGQFNDLLRILKLSGDPSETGYLFLGDYVDRGKQSLETITLLLLYKIKYSQTFFMLRGNHESSQVTKIYGFYDECKRRCGTSKVWKYYVDCFNSLPFAGIISDKIFCVHGGISPYLQDMSQIEKILRPTEVPQDGLLTDLLWSDPEKNIVDWQPNSDRGVSCYFSKKNVSTFCKRFQFDLVIRGHMVVEDGYEFFGKKRLVTIFSAPNYCGEFNNWGAVMDVDKDLICSFELLKPRKNEKKLK